jgi:hypothetical protein
MADLCTTNRLRLPTGALEKCSECGKSDLVQHDALVICHSCGCTSNCPMLDHWTFWGDETYSRPKKRYKYKRQGHLKKQLQKILPRTVAGKELQECIDPLFKQLEESFDVVVARPGETRHNFLSYHYVIFKILELLGHDGLLTKCKLLKSKVRLKELERLWKEICADAHWQYIPLLDSDAVKDRR